MTVTSAAGFRAAGVVAGLKSNGSPDLALVLNDGPDNAAAAVFTTNRFQAAPVLWSQQVVRDGRLRAVLLNSGGANACTGPDGFADTHRSAEYAASAVGVDAGDVAVCSTGLIGERLPMNLVLPGIDKVAGVLSADGGADAAEAIRTTDTVAKVDAVRHDAGWTVGGMAKGAGMLAPGMATMLCVLTTDAVIDASTLDTSLREASRLTFERLDSDGCMSTNDTVVLMSSGASGVAPDDDDFAAALTEVCRRLARQLLADAEGASKEIAIEVRGAETEAQALDVARAISRSNLLMCALYGNDPNWGRVLAAIGTTAATFDPDHVDVSINRVPVCVGGSAGADRSEVDLTRREVSIDVDLRAGDASAWIWTNDLTHAYVEENSAYST